MIEKFKPVGNNVLVKVTNILEDTIKTKLPGSDPKKPEFTVSKVTNYAIGEVVDIGQVPFTIGSIVYFRMVDPSRFLVIKENLDTYVSVDFSQIFLIRSK